MTRPCSLPNYGLALFGQLSLDNICSCRLCCRAIGCSGQYVWHIGEARFYGVSLCTAHPSAGLVLLSCLYTLSLPSLCHPFAHWPCARVQDYQAAQALRRAMSSPVRIVRTASTWNRGLSLFMSCCSFITTNSSETLTEAQHGEKADLFIC